MTIEERLRKVEQRLAIMEAALGGLLQDMGADDEEPPQLEDMDGNEYPPPPGGRTLS